MKELTESEALGKVAAYCSMAEHCASEVISKLESWNIPAEAIERILERLDKEKYMDEGRYCRCFVNDKLRFNKWGKVKIAQTLYQKQISQEAIRASLDAVDEDEYQRILLELLISKKKSVKAKSDYELNGKLIRFALGRGYGMDVIQRCLKQICSDIELDY